MTTSRLSDCISPAFYDVHSAIKQGAVSHIWLKGGRASTKSSFVAIELILELIKNPNMNAVCLRRQDNTLRDSVYAKLCWAIDQLGLGDVFTRNLSPLTITYEPTGQQILFRGTDRPEKLKSLTFRKGYCGLIWFEELDQFTSMEQVRNIRQSLVRGGEKHLVFYSYNPPRSTGNWVNAEAAAQQSNSNYLIHSSDYRSVPREWLGEAFYDEAEDLKKRNEQSYRHEYLGESVGSGTQVFTNIITREITDEEIKSFDRINQGLDWGYFPDPFAYTKNHYQANNRTLYIFDEAGATKCSNEMIADILKPKIYLGSIMWCDTSENRSTFRLKELGIANARPCTKGPNSVNFGVKWLQSLDAIVIDMARTPKTAREFTRYEYELDRSGDVLPTLPDRDNHWIDATRYSLQQVMARRGA